MFFVLIQVCIKIMYSSGIHNRYKVKSELYWVIQGEYKEKKELEGMKGGG